VFDTASGQARFDHFEGHWGAPEHLGKFLVVTHFVEHSDSRRVTPR
jgi:hypothetical protein